MNFSLMKLWLIHFSSQADWPRFFSYSPDIHKYLVKVCETFGLRKYMTFNTQVVGCYWKYVDHCNDMLRL